MRAHDAAIQRLRGVVIGHGAAEGKAHRGAAGAGIAPEVDADQLARGEAPRGLLAHLAHDRLEQRLAGLDVAGGLVEDQAAIDALLDDEEAAVDLRDGRNGDLGCADMSTELYAVAVRGASRGELRAARARGRWRSRSDRIPAGTAARRADC